MHRARDRAADFHHQPSAGTQRRIRLRQQSHDDLDSGWPAKHGAARLKLTNFELHLIFFRFAYVGRIGYDEVQLRQSKPIQQISLMKIDSRFKLMPRRVRPSDFERRSGDVGGIKIRVRKFFGQRERNGARPSPNIDDSKPSVGRALLPAGCRRKLEKAQSQSHAPSPGAESTPRE